MYDYPETTDDQDVKTHAYLAVENGKKQYFFNRDEYEYKTFLLKKDGSNLTEYTKMYDECTSAQYQGSLDDSLLFTYGMKVTTESDTKVYSIDSGFYDVSYSDKLGYFLTEMLPSTGDKYIDLGEHLNSITDNINKFYDKKDVYEKLCMKHKLGMLLYGPPGSGKTTKIREIIKQYKDTKVIIFVDTQFPKSLIKNLKAFNQDFIFIFEEFVQNINSDDKLADMLLFLDGENSLDNQLVLATTNYPEALPSNLASRPGRFDKLIKVDDPDEDTRRKYLEGIMTEEVTEKIIKETKGFSIAYLREIFLASQINETDILTEIKNNKARKKLVEKAFADSSERKLGL